MKHLSTALRLLLISLLTTIIVVFLKMAFEQQYYKSDFISFYSSAQILLQNPSKLYDFSTQYVAQRSLLPTHINFSKQYFFPYLNPPIFLIPWTWLTKFPYQTAYRLAVIANISFIIISITWLYRISRLPKQTKFILLLILLSFAPSYSTLFLTQSSYLTLLIYLAVYTLLKHKKLFLAGLTASILAYKPQLGILLFLYLVILKRKNLTLGLSLGLLIAFITSWIITQGHLFTIINAIPQFLEHTGTGPSIRITWLGLFSQIQEIIPRLPATSMAIIFSLITIFIVFKKIHKYQPNSSNFNYVYSLIIITTLISTLHQHYQETILLALPLFFLYPRTHKQIKRYYIIIFLGWFIYLITIFNPFYPHYIYYFPNLYILLILVLTYYSYPKKNLLNHQHLSKNIL